MKIPVIQTDEFILYIEQMSDCLVIHCDVLKKWTKEVKNRLTVSFEELTERCGQPLYALHVPSDKKHEKFLKMFNFSYFKSITGVDGNDYDIYVWR